MKKLHRYYLKELTLNALISGVVLFGIVLISFVYRGLTRAQGFGFAAAAEITLYMAADSLQHLMPIALLFATVLTFARASRDREITAIRAAGISPRTALVPAMLLGVLVSLFAMQVFHQIAPEFHFRKFRVVADGIRKLMSSTGMMTDRFETQNILMTWDRKTPDNHWHEVIIRVLRKQPELGPLQAGVFLADEAWIEDSGDDVLTMAFRNARNIASDTAGPSSLPEFTRISVSLRSIVADEELRKEDERDQTSDQLLAEVYRGVHKRPITAEYTVARRTCFGLLPALLAPIGFCIGVMARDRGRVTALVFSLVPLCLFYFADFFGTQFVRATEQPLFAYTAAVVLALAGIPFCWRLLRL